MPSPDLLLAIDQGTTSTRAILFDAAGQERHSSRLELHQHYPRPGWVEHDPEEIWRSVAMTCRAAVAAAGDAPIVAIGITNQRETAVLWERATGRPVHNAIVWQDRRTAGLCETWRAAGLTETVAERTGLIIDPYFSASKIRWLLDEIPGLRQRAAAGEIAFGTVDAFLLWRLTGGRLHATDVTNAARTMLFDLYRLAWDDGLLDAFGIPRALLPEVRDTDGDFGTTAPELFGRPIPIAGVAGDQQAAAIGQACFRPGMVKSTYGTGAFALLHTGDAPALSSHRLLTTIAYRLGGETAYALEGSIFIAGAAVQWLRDRLRAVAAAPETQALAERADPRQRLYFVPAFAGLGAPYWSAEARGSLSGLTAECGLPEIARATLEAVAYQTRDLITAMTADCGLPIDTLRVDGGMAGSDWTMQFLADILPARVERPEIAGDDCLGRGLHRRAGARRVPAARRYDGALAGGAVVRADNGRQGTRGALRRLAAGGCRRISGGWRMIPSGNLLRDLPDARGGEVIESLSAAPGMRIERIVSFGQASPPGFWYDQPQAEWVLLLAGAARLRFADEPAPRPLGPGDWVEIVAHRRHRVDWTDPATPTVWLAVFHP